MLENFAMARLKTFSLDRAKTDTASTSRLSPHVHYGEISVRHVYYVVRSAGRMRRDRCSLLATCCITYSDDGRQSCQ